MSYMYVIGICSALSGLFFSYVAYPFLGKITEQKLGVDPRVARFVLPLGLSINKDGSAFFLCVSIMYIAQTYGIELNVAHYLVMW